ncbi:MAG: acetylxylan esterase [Bacteroidales bacterium]|nr:acetylxylan esterase [Bacteroidales bacterium]
MSNKLITSAVCLLCSLASLAQTPGGQAAPQNSAPRPRQAEIIPGQTPTSPTLEEYFTPVTTPSATPDKDGFIGRWLMLEPIAKPNRSNTPFVDSYIREAFSHQYFPGQFSMTLPKDGQKEKVTVDLTPQPMFMFGGGAPTQPEPKIEKRTLKWHAMDSKLFNVKLFRYAAGLKMDVYGVVFYVCTVVNAPEDIDNIRLAVGSNSASQWWLNGEEALILSGDRRMVMDDAMSARLSLKKGRNVIWGAIINGPGMSDFCVRFVDEAGNPVKNLTITTK